MSKHFTLRTGSDAHMFEKRFLEALPISVRKRPTPIQEIWDLAEALMQRKIVRVVKGEMSEAKLLALENILDQRNWKLEIHDNQEDTEILYLRAFNWIVADGKSEYDMPLR
jgi:hypothetical protein